MAGLFVVNLAVFKESIRSSKVHPLVVNAAGTGYRPLGVVKWPYSEESGSSRSSIGQERAECVAESEPGWANCIAYSGRAVGIGRLRRTVCQCCIRAASPAW